MTDERSSEGAGPSAVHVAVVFHSQQGHVARLASRVAEGVTSRANVGVDCFDLDQSHSDLLDRLHGADAVIFGCPTFMGGPSAVFKTFAEASLPVWAARDWCGKIAAGFTHSQAMSGDKLNTLTYFALLAAQHGMIWTNLDLLPGWCWDAGSADDLNRLGGWLGAMSQSNGDGSPAQNPRESDLATAEHLGRLVATTATALKLGRASLVAAQPVDAPIEASGLVIEGVAEA